MGKALADPERPFVAILGGAKVSDKLNVINNLLEKVDTLIIGGGMAYTFLAAKGYSVGTSLLDNEKIDYCKEMMAKAEAKGVKLLLPIDTVVAANFPDPIDGDIAVETVPSDAIPADKMGLDIGEKTRALFAAFDVESANRMACAVKNSVVAAFFRCDGSGLRCRFVRPDRCPQTAAKIDVLRQFRTGRIAAVSGLVHLIAVPSEFIAV